MAKGQNPAELVLICFSILYSGLSILGIIRTLKMYKTISITKFAKFFYVFICLESFLRSITFIIILSDLSDITYTAAFILATLPDALFVHLYLILLVISMRIYYQAHIVSTLSQSLLEKTVTKKSKFVWTVLGLITVLVILQLISYSIYLGSSMSADQISEENALVNIIVPSMGAIYILYLDFVFSGVPTRNPIWKSNLHRICTVSIFWTISRIIKGILDLIDQSSIVGVINAVVDPKQSVTLLKSALCIAVIIIAELICMFLVFDYGFFAIFIPSESDSQNTTTSNEKTLAQRDKLSLVATNPYIEEDDIKIIEQLKVTKKKPLGMIYKAEFNQSEVFYRIMSFSRLSSYVTEDITKEIDSYKSMSASGIEPVLGIVFKASTVGLVYPYFPQGSLFKLLHESKAILSLEQKIIMIQGIAEDLVEIHAEKRCHGHLTSHNILLDKKLNPFISDLGFHKMKKYAGVMYEYSYKSSWSSPEVLNDKKLIPSTISPSDDSYSFGMICWEIFTQKIPFEGFNKIQLAENVSKNGFRPLLPEEMPEDIVKIVKSCWNEDPNKRPDMSLIAMGLSMRESEI